MQNEEKRNNWASATHAESILGASQAPLINIFRAGVPEQRWLPDAWDSFFDTVYD